MGNKKIIIQNLLIILFIMFTIRSYSQEFFTKELRWLSRDSIEIPVFHDTNQIIEWGCSIGPFYSVQSEKYSIENNDIFILIIDKCSGIYCPFIYIFKESDNFWELITNTNARLKELIKINVDTTKKKIIFFTESGQTGELPFDIFRCIR